MIATSHPARRWTSLAAVPCASAILAACLAGCGGPTPAPGPEKTSASLEWARAQHFDGWGVSLAWWAEIVGGWPLDTQAPLLNLLYGNPNSDTGLTTSSGQPIHPLGLNVVRYNIGASEHLPSAPIGPHDTCSKGSFRAGGEVPSVIPRPGEPADLTLDPNQVGVLKAALTLIRQRPDISPQLEAFANSPPWWLIHNRCPEGDGSTTVMPSSAPGPGTIPPIYAAALAYGAYLRKVVQAFQLAGIAFRSVDPLNEPSFGWACTSPGSCQEGAHFDDAAQASVLQDACRYLSPLGITVSADDGNTPGLTESFLRAQLGALNCVGQVNTHSYIGSSALGDEVNLATTTRPTGRPLWMSEFGNGPQPCSSHSDPELCTATTGDALAAHIADDLNNLTPSAWVYWTALEEPGGWGLLTDASFTQRSQPPATIGAGITPSARFWALGQYSRFVPPGSTIIPVRPQPTDSQVHMAAALTPQGQFVLVATNPSTSPEPFQLDLGTNRRALSGPTAYRTDDHLAESQISPNITVSGSLLSSGPLPPGSITTYVFSGTGIDQGGIAILPTLPVVRCPTEFGISGPSPHTPATVTVRSSSSTRGLAAYTNTRIYLIGPRGMRCSGLVAADGGSQVIVWPQGHSRPGPNARTDGLTLTLDPACAGCKADDACPFFTALARDLRFPCASGVPQGERVYRLRPDIMLFTDPSGVAASGWPSGGQDPANGLVGYTGSPENGLVYRSTCTLPASDHSVCTTSLNDVIHRYG